MGQLPLGGGDEDAKRFGDLANMRKLLLYFASLNC